MSKNYCRSLIFSLLIGVSGVAVATSVLKSDPYATVVVTPVFSDAVSERADLNHADAATLQRVLTGVGEAKAQAIVRYRDTNGPFASVDELLEVKGIGKVILDKNRDKLEVN